MTKTKKAVFTVLGCVFSATLAMATPVTYYTTGAFGGTDVQGNTLVNGGATISFTGIPSTTVSAPTNGSLGVIHVSGGTGLFNNDTFTLNILESSPDNGGGNSSTSVTGTVTNTSNGIALQFAPNPIMIGSTEFQLQSFYLLVQIGTNGGNTSLQMMVSVTPSVSTPEPASASMLGASGLVCSFFGIFMRKKRQSKVENPTA